ncbi:hypothetical protein pdul_cds_828 [Pandoravirus dulcis]|uniref:Uncharacterized protein n=1 Tax=Pandoravirus dulcis TaxID=1349409 RepID=S4VRX9_9VIRU|nr:hypothetical protein pdul_cds_828 [Pandoravirus dulcis]AGO83037.1 hypothetical protein pdul_cds_828 [Pandoravirus dulcis]
MATQTTTVTKTKSVATSRTIALRPRKTTRQKPRRPPSISSWDGFEHYRDQVRAVAREIAESDAAVRTTMRSVLATGLICAAIRDPTTAPTPEVARAARAQESLRDLMGVLVQEHNLDWFFVRREWLAILEPRLEEGEHRDRILAEHAARRPTSRRTRSPSFAAAAAVTETTGDH